MSKTEPANAYTTSHITVLQVLKNIFLDLNLYSRQAVFIRVWRM